MTFPLARVYKHTSEVVLGADVYPEMPRKKSNTVPVDNSPVPQDTSRLLGEITVVELRQMMSEEMGNFFYEVTSHFDQ